MLGELSNTPSISPQERLYRAIIDGKFNEVKIVVSKDPELATKPFDKKMPRFVGYTEHHTPMILALHCLIENKLKFDIVECLHQHQASLMQIDSEGLNPLMIVLSHSTTENFRKLVALLKAEELKTQLNHRAKGNNVLSFATSYMDSGRTMLLELADLYTPEQLASELSFVNANKKTALTSSYGDPLDMVHRELAACAQLRHKYEEHGLGTMAQRKEKAHAVFAEVVSEYLKKLKDIQNTPPVVENAHFIVAKKKFEAISQYFDEALRQLAAWDVEKLLEDPLVKTFKEHMRTFESKQLVFRKEPQLTYHRHESKIREEYDEMLRSAICGIQACEVAVLQPTFDSSVDVPKSTPILDKFIGEIRKRKEGSDKPAEAAKPDREPKMKERKVSEPK